MAYLMLPDSNRLAMENRATIDPAMKAVVATGPAPAHDGPSGLLRRLIGWLRDPSWLTRQRVKFYSGVLLLAYLVAAIGQLLHAHHLMFANGIPVGGDFMNPYAASVAALKGDPASVYNLQRQHLLEVAVMGKDFGVLGSFTYPPMYLLIALPLSLLPFAISWVVFETVTLAGYIAVLRRIASAPLGLWLAITFPAVIINFMCGQNGFLTTALLGGGLLLLDRSPLLAGALFGLMAYKPQFAVLIPLALLVGRRWRALIATAASAAVFASVSLAVFGVPTWRAFFGGLAFTEKVVLERGAINFWTLQSVFGAIRMWGGSVDAAYLFQIMVALYAAAAVIWVWRSGSRLALRGATLAAGSLMVSPYVLQYDLVLLALPIAWMAMEGFEQGFLPYEKVMLVAAWILPRISLPISHSVRIPIAPIAIILLMTTILRRATRSDGADEGSPVYSG